MLRFEIVKILLQIAKIKVSVLQLKNIFTYYELFETERISLFYDYF